MEKQERCHSPCPHPEQQLQPQIGATQTEISLISGARPSPCSTEAQVSIVELPLRATQQPSNSSSHILECPPDSCLLAFVKQRFFPMISNGQARVMEKPGARPRWQEEAHLGTPLMHQPHRASPALGPALRRCQPCLPGSLCSLGHAQPVIPPTLLAQTFHPSQPFCLWVPPCCAQVSPRSPSTETNLCKSS